LEGAGAGRGRAHRRGRRRPRTRAGGVGWGALMATVVRMPQLAAGGTEAAIQAWLVGVGDTVEAGQAIVEIETEKAVVEYEAEASGSLAATLVDAGASATVGAPIAVLAAADESAEDAIAAAGVEASAAPSPAASEPEPEPA